MYLCINYVLIMQLFINYVFINIPPKRDDFWRES